MSSLKLSRASNGEKDRLIHKLGEELDDNKATITNYEDSMGILGTEIKENKETIKWHEETIKDLVDEPQKTIKDLTEQLSKAREKNSELYKTINDKERATMQSEAGYKPPFLGTCPTCGRDTICSTLQAVGKECDECKTAHEPDWVKKETKRMNNKYPDPEADNIEFCQNCGRPEPAPRGATVLCKICVDTEEDLIAKPNHYNWHPVAECKDIVSHFKYNKGTAIAYVWRSEHKGTEEDDLKKAIQHLQFELELIERLGKDIE
jgi:hypothetical protein